MAIGINRLTWEKIGKKAGWLPTIKTSGVFDDYRQKAKEHYENSQPIDPSAPNFAVNLLGPSVSIPTNIRQKINNKLAGFNQYYHSIPFNEIISLLKTENIILVQEDGTVWEGIVMAPKGVSQQPFHFQLAMKRDGDVKFMPCNNLLVLSVHRMESGKLEITTYIS